MLPIWRAKLSRAGAGSTGPVCQIVNKLVSAPLGGLFRPEGQVFSKRYLEPVGLGYPEGLPGFMEAVFSSGVSLSTTVYVAGRVVAERGLAGLVTREV